MNSLFAFGMPGMQDLIVIGAIALLFFGPKRLPELARSLRKSVDEFRDAKSEFGPELHRSAAEDPVAKPVAPERLEPAATAPVAVEPLRPA